MNDVFEEVPNWREAPDRPEYVLKNGKAQNGYGLLRDIHELQSVNERLTEIAAAKATRCDELFEELERVSPDSPLLEKIRNESTD